MFGRGVQADLAHGRARRSIISLVSSPRGDLRLFRTSPTAKQDGDDPPKEQLERWGNARPDAHGHKLTPQFNHNGREPRCAFEGIRPGRLLLTTSSPEAHRAVLAWHFKE